jgi:putative aldouronate transport system permease protein
METNQIPTALLAQKFPKRKKPRKQRFQTYVTNFGFFYLFLLPAVIALLVFRYVPMLGIVIAFKDYNMFAGNNPLDAILVSEWVGLEHFRLLFSMPEIWRVFRNTLIISVYKIVFLFPLPIIVAVMINEVKNVHYKKSIQTVLYLPHFLSWVVVTALFMQILGAYGVVNNWLTAAGLIEDPMSFFGNNNTFRSLLVVSSGWKETGWNAIVYLAAITGINPQLYEAAKIDGATKIQQIVYITVPSISATIAMLFVLRLGYILDAGFDQVFNMYNAAVYDKSDIISTYVYRYGIGQMKYSFTTAVGLFNSTIALFMILSGNYISSKYFKKGMW